jgi:cytochrome c oxidase subunit 1/cytochrome c oxidase subunit I+III
MTTVPTRQRPDTAADSGHDRRPKLITDSNEAVRVSEERVGDRVAEHWPEGEGVRGFISTVDHKRIGRRYIITAGFFFTLAGLNAMLMRIQLMRPGQQVISPEEYNQLFTVHGTVMIFFFSTPMLFGFGNLLFPLMLGTRDMAFPRLNAFGYWIFAASGLILFGSEAAGRAPDGGWFSYVPLTGKEFSPAINLDVYCLALLFLGTSTTVGAINFIVTALKLRAPGMTLARMPVFVWALVVVSFMVLFALPPLNTANVMLLLDRQVGTHFFDPQHGGDAVLWQHLFWLFGHPDVYIIVLPALGMVSAIVPTFSRRPIAAYPLIVVATIATGIISFGVWVHHMFAVGLPPLSMAFFSAASIVVVIPAGIQFMSWLITMLRGRIVLSVPMLWVFGFIAAFVVGGVTGPMFALVSFDQQVTDSYFVVAHFHYVLFGGAVLPMLAGLYYWWPKLTGRMTSRRGGVWSFWLVFAGFNVTFFPMHIQGLLGMPRRIYTFPAWTGWAPYNLLETLGAFLLAFGFVFTGLVFLHSWRRGAPAPADPWGGETLEWATTSPPQTHNFAVIPTVHSLHPLWDQASLDSFAYGAERDDRVLADGHETLMTSELDGEPERRLEMPEDSPVPFFTTAALTALVLGLLFRIYPLAAIGLLGTAIALCYWLWPFQGPAMALEEPVPEPEDVS